MWGFDAWGEAPWGALVDDDVAQLPPFITTTLLCQVPSASVEGQVPSVAVVCQQPSVSALYLRER